MNLEDVIKGRRSIKRFEEREVSPELIQELLDIAVWAPNHRMTEPWRFIMFYGEGKERLAATVRQMKENKEPDPSKKKSEGEKIYNKLMANPMFLMVVMEEDPNLVTREEDFAATSCVIQNFSLLAWEKGIGMTWHSYGWLQDAMVREALGIKPGERAIANMHIGYPAMLPKERERKTMKELLTIVNQ
ncbi:nitroreductase family protein [Bacillus massiliigorillae]|uniref:nitroreductase family protein n=1 Tax=Bacillus massiliigorillae TaxID=1243664 RepID=UPI0003999543|nr:nitroreductase [Bacillus massiliigorillae]